MSVAVAARRRFSKVDWRDPNTLTYVGLGFLALIYPTLVYLINPDQGPALVSQAADAGVFVVMALGLNVVVGFAGLLDLGYAAFFAIGAYTYGMLASGQLALSPIGHQVHLPFWVLLFVAVLVAATCGAILGAPTLRLRGDYLAIVTLGFGEIVPRVFRNLSQFTGGVNAISAIDAPVLPYWIDGPWDGGASFAVVQNLKFTAGEPTAYYVLMVLIILAVVVVIRNAQRSRIGRAWMAVREDEVAAEAMGVNTVNIKLLAFAIGASVSGFAGCYFGAKLSTVSPENFTFLVSVTILLMVTLGGMGNIPGAIVGALVIYFVQYKLLSDLPHWVAAGAGALNLGQHATNVATDYATRLNFVIFGLILAVTMLLRPQGLLPSRVRAQELQRGTTDESVFDAAAT
ncbi:MAG: branched-chain amino acid ABC transporter permease [Candidatus Dormibacteraeota bacterium]|nr:branched-chain amino acid ABC transporter permease [Candidatus Dormibacteraeota bacterium]